MAPRVNSSLEALGTLLHLIRDSLGNPAEATTYLNIADKVLIEIASNRPLSPAQVASPHDLQLCDDHRNSRPA
jgi:hypothetical protein